ncbi:hypothetical protein [Rhodococcus ruber]
MRLPAEQLVFGWATKTLERHGTGTGVLGFSPGWADWLPTQALDLGRLVQLWGDRQSMPRGIDALTASSFEFTRIEGRCVLARRSHDSSQRSGAVFAHLLAFESPNFGLAEALACATGEMPYRDRRQLQADVPNPGLPRIILDVPAFHRTASLPAQALTEVVAAGLLDALDTRPDAPRLTLVTEDADAAVAALADAVHLLPRALTQPMTLSTFEYQVGTHSPAVTVALSRLSKIVDTRERVIVDLTRPDACRQSVTPENLALVAELVAAARDGLPLDQDTATPHDLRRWSEALRLRHAHADELSVQQLATLLAYDKFAKPWFAQRENRHRVVARALTHAELGEPLRSAYRSSGIDAYRDLAEICLFILHGQVDPAAAANLVGADPRRLADEIRALFVHEFRRGTTFDDTQYGLVLPRPDEEFDPDMMWDLAQSVPLRRYALHTPWQFTVAVLRAEVISDRPDTELLAELAQHRRTDVDYFAHELVCDTTPHTAVDLLCRGFGNEITFQVLTHITEADHGPWMREFLAAPDLTPQVRVAALSEYWPTILDWITLDPAWIAAMREVLVVADTEPAGPRTTAEQDAPYRLGLDAGDGYGSPRAAPQHIGGNKGAASAQAQRSWWKFWDRASAQGNSRQMRKNA